MGLPLRERAGLGKTSGGVIAVPGSREAMARAGAWFAALAALVGLLALVLPHNPGMDEVAMAAITAAAAGLAVIALVGFTRLPVQAFAVGAVLGTVAAAGAVHYWGTASFYGPLPFLFPLLYASWFLPRRFTVFLLALVGALFAGTIAWRDPGYSPVAAWVATVGTLGGAALLLSLARDGITQVISDLTDAARRDPLTGLLNRRGFEEAFDVEIERARRTEQSLSVIVGDLDRFKEINDQHGHAAGDEALRRVGQAMRSSKRSWDAAARVGGEEFAILAPDTDEHGAYILAERIRTEIEQSFASGPTGPLTASFGIVSYPVHGQTAETLLQAGDQALYAAKRLGRNRSVISSAEVPGILARGSRPGHEESPVELATLLSLAEALDVRDTGSASHCRRVGRFSELIAREMGLPPDSVERVRIAGVLHDVGRVGMPDDVLVKQGPLSPEEWNWVHSHPEIGARMLETTEFGDIGRWILGHHERPDGTGYPRGAKGDDLPLEASILAVADAYEAMTAVRPYREPLDAQGASDELRRGAGRQWDERVVDALLRVV
jgi:diguanylate cyclase (GGDEF)-like protein